jgi:hypothetical protein
MGNKVIVLKFTSPFALTTIIRKVVFVDEAKGERAIDKIEKHVEKMYKDKLFVKGSYALASIETLWEET